MSAQASDSFISSLSSLPADLASRLRKLKSGIFIREEDLTAISASYKEWLSANDLGVKEGSTLNRRIFGDNAGSANSLPVLSYLPEGQLCFAGYLAACSQERLLDLGNIAESKSSLISAVDYIHPKDQWLQTNNSIRLRQSAEQGTIFEFVLKEGSLRMKEPLLRHCAKLLRSSGLFIEKYPEIKTSLRHVLPVLHSLLKEGRAPSKKYHTFLTDKVAKLQKAGSGTILLSSNVLFYSDATGVITDIFEQRGKNFRALILEELQLLKSGSERFIDTIDLTNKDPEYPLRVKINGKQFVIEKQAILSLAQDAGRSPWFRQKLAPFYTLRDVLVAIAFPLKYADWVDSAHSTESPGAGHAAVPQGRQVSQGRQARQFQLRYLPWTFLTGRNNSIRGFVELGASGKGSEGTSSAKGKNFRTKRGNKTTFSKNKGSFNNQRVKSPEGACKVVSKSSPEKTDRPPDSGGMKNDK